MLVFKVANGNIHSGRRSRLRLNRWRAQVSASFDGLIGAMFDGVPRQAIAACDIPRAPLIRRTGTCTLARYSTTTHLP